MTKNVMINTTNPFEKFLQNQRFSRVKKHIKGDVMDFGGNEGELKPFVTGKYLVVNYDHSVLKKHQFDTIIALAVVEHIKYKTVFEIFKKLTSQHLRKGGRVFLTTPTPASKPVLEALAAVHILEKQNIDEHEHYWTEKELRLLAKKNGLKVLKYKKFQIGFNQEILLEKVE